MQNKVGFTFFRNVEHEVNIKKKNILAYGLSGQEKIRTFFKNTYPRDQNGMFL